jgi:hypothetical protein
MSKQALDPSALQAGDPIELEGHGSGGRCRMAALTRWRFSQSLGLRAS